MISVVAGIVYYMAEPQQKCHTGPRGPPGPPGPPGDTKASNCTAAIVRKREAMEILRIGLNDNLWRPECQKEYETNLNRAQNFPQGHARAGAVDQVTRNRDAFFHICIEQAALQTRELIRKADVIITRDCMD